VTLAVPSNNAPPSTTLESTGVSTLGASLASLAPSTPFPVATPPPLAQGPFRSGGLSQQASFVSDSLDASANHSVSPNIHDTAAAVTVTPVSTQSVSTAPPPPSVSSSSLAPASSRTAAVRTPKTPKTPKSSASRSSSPRKIPTHAAVPALFHGPAEEEWERRGRANTRPPQVLQEEAAWREYTPRGIILSAYKALPPQRAPWRPASQVRACSFPSDSLRERSLITSVTCLIL
jgi:hypothetical protein